MSERRSPNMIATERVREIFAARIADIEKRGVKIPPDGAQDLERAVVALLEECESETAAVGDCLNDTIERNREYQREVDLLIRFIRHLRQGLEQAPVGEPWTRYNAEWLARIDELLMGRAAGVSEWNAALEVAASEIRELGKSVQGGYNNAAHDMAEAILKLKRST